MRHGNYKQISHRDAYEQSLAEDFTIAGLDDRLFRGSGQSLHVVHIVAPADFYEHDNPVGYEVELARPIWLYGNEGLLSELEFLGRASDEWLDAIEADWFPEVDPFPYSDFWWKLPNQKYFNGEYVSDPWKQYEGKI